MIRNPEFPTAAEILQLFTSGEVLPDRVGGGGTMQERTAAQASTAEIAATKPENIRAVCIACGLDVPLLEVAGCRCGGFVCRICEALEDDGVCNHEPHILFESDDDDSGHQ